MYYVPRSIRFRNKAAFDHALRKAERDVERARIDYPQQMAWLEAHLDLIDPNKRVAEQSDKVLNALGLTVQAHSRMRWVTGHTRPLYVIMALRAVQTSTITNRSKFKGPHPKADEQDVGTQTYEPKRRGSW